MRTLKSTEEYRVNSEFEAKEAMEKFREEAKSKGYNIGKCGYVYKNKKSKGDIIDEAWIVSVTKIFSDVWA